MFLWGVNSVGGKNACAVTPTSINKMNYVEIKNGIYDYLYLTQDTTITLDNCPPTEWDFNTLLWAKFNENTNAGNIDNSLSNTTHLIVKSRPVGDFLWKTLAVKEVKTVDDFSFYYNDYAVPSGQETEYAIVPVYYGIEGTYSTITATPIFDKLFLIEDETVYGTFITDAFCDTTRNIPSNNLELLNMKYPIFVRNTIANYDTGTCNGNFVKVSDDCTLQMNGEYNYSRTKYQKEVMDFICDGVPKILKMPDGRIWLVQVTPNPSNSADGIYWNRNISFSWVEIGDINSEEDLYYLGLSNVSPEWWNH